MNEQKLLSLALTAADMGLSFLMAQQHATRLLARAREEGRAISDAELTEVKARMDKANGRWQAALAELRAEARGAASD